MPRRLEMTVTEKALEPDLPMGAEIVCAEGVTPEPGDFVVYFPRGAAAPLFRRWRTGGTPDEVLLEALDGKSVTYTCPRAELYARGRILVILSMKRIFRELAEENKDSGAPTAASSSGDWLTFREAMALLKVRRTRMYELLQKGELRAVKLGRLWRIDRSAIQEFLAGSPVRD